MKNWVVSVKKGKFDQRWWQFGIDPLIAKLLINRGVIEEDTAREYLYGTIKDLPSPWKLKNMQKAVDILQKKIEEKARIRIIGDYDIDGVTATYILLRGLTRIGAKTDTYIPDRIEDGYGLNDKLIERAARDKIDTIVTCDNGISAVSQIQMAKDMGITVIITDHHDIKHKGEYGEGEEDLPPADAILNPKQSDCPYPNKNICGAVVAFKYIIALYERFGIPKEELDDYYELAAIATVGDVMDLQGENRILVKEGLQRLMHTRNKGLQQLIHETKLENKNITAYHIGFVLGPCINASGRIATANLSLRLLNAKTTLEAQILAEELVKLNETRKNLTEEGKEKAIEMVEQTELGNDKILVIYLPECHESIAGIIAGRIRERYNKPTFILTKGENCIKGSGRSIEAYSMHAEMEKCRKLFLNFGGHPLAAGLSIREENIEELRKQLNENCNLTEEDLQPKILLDEGVPFDYLTEERIEQLSILEPFGKGNPKPIFGVRDLKILDFKIIGKNKNVVKLKLLDKKTVMDGIYFGEAEEFAGFLRKHETMDIIYYPEINEYRDNRTIQIIIQDYREPLHRGVQRQQ